MRTAAVRVDRRGVRMRERGGRCMATDVLGVGLGSSDY